MNVWVEWQKWGGAGHYRYELDLLGEDEHGRWLASRKGRPVYKGREFFAEQTGIGVLLVPAEHWWTARFRPDGYIYADVCTPGVWADSSVTLVDLDLDVIKDGVQLAVHDADEFEENRVRLGYPENLVQQATKTADELVDMMTRGIEPFGVASALWMNKPTAPVTD